MDGGRTPAVPVAALLPTLALLVDCEHSVAAAGGPWTLPEGGTTIQG